MTSACILTGANETQQISTKEIPVQINTTIPTQNTTIPPTDLPTIVPPTPTQVPTVVVPSPTPTAQPQNNLEGMLILSISEAGYSHLFAMQAGTNTLTRLTTGDVNDMDPALSPDGSKIAFSSDRNGQPDIFVLNLINGETIQITKEFGYEGHPSWSPDGLWLAYERFQNENLDLIIQPIDDSIPPVRITFDNALDFSPSWGPDGRTIAFTSNRNGNLDIWTIDIENIGNPGYLQSITSSFEDQSEPAWSPDGKQIVWSSTHQGFRSIFIADTLDPESTTMVLGKGGNPSWDPSGKYILASFQNPRNNQILIYDLEYQEDYSSPQQINGRIDGLSWSQDSLPDNLQENLQTIADQIIPSLEIPSMPTADLGFNRQDTVFILDLITPNPQFNDLVIPSFNSLRQRMVKETGWDVLAVLENAFVPLTQKLAPGNNTNWLYTGRAFSLNQTGLDYGWMIVVREDFGEETFWRLFLRPLIQDGSQGEPLTNYNWIFDTRKVGEDSYVGPGGLQTSEIPAGYWVDFTAIAENYGWSRQPALNNWQGFYPGIRYNLFAATNNLTWEEAMLQLYPEEIFMAPISETLP